MKSRGAGDADGTAVYDPFAFGRMYAALMEARNWTPEQIGRFNFYQAFVALGHEPPDPPMNKYEFARRLARFS